MDKNIPKWIEGLINNPHDIYETVLERCNISGNDFKTELSTVRGYYIQFIGNQETSEKKEDDWYRYALLSYVPYANIMTTYRRWECVIDAARKNNMPVKDLSKYILNKKHNDLFDEEIKTLKDTGLGGDSDRNNLASTLKAHAGGKEYMWRSIHGEKVTFYVETQLLANKNSAVPSPVVKEPEPSSEIPGCTDATVKYLGVLNKVILDGDVPESKQGEFRLGIYNMLEKALFGGPVNLQMPEPTAVAAIDNLNDLGKSQYVGYRIDSLIRAKDVPGLSADEYMGDYYKLGLCLFGKEGYMDLVTKPSVGSIIERLGRDIANIKNTHEQIKSSIPDTEEVKLASKVRVMSSLYDQIAPKDSPKLASSYVVDKNAGVMFN